ncbi:dockerin type I domain-containing protein [Lacrimispora sp.]|uniref:dockerin type I domain-containing protein n=1 Tax=Lacrimispora sp. TaxID=2719234 RepID=UPI0028B005C1|nr:dockerin type I domain-containing protein [Lacrimispora sp.]
MKKYKKARRMAAILASVLVLDSSFGVVTPYINAYAYTERSATVNATSLNVRSGPGTTYSIVTKLTNGASVSVTDEKNGSDGALWYQIRVSNSAGQKVTGYVTKSYLKFPTTYTQDGNFESQLTAEGFPESYKIRLRELHAQHPQWVFRAQKTNLDWNTAVREESQVGKTLVHTSSMSSWKSMLNGAYNWDTSTWVGFDGSSWVTASEDIVKYYMDPRNFLDETNVFQFLSHSYDSNKQTMDGLQTMTKGTFLSGGSSSGGNSTNSSNTSNPTGNTQNAGPGGTVSPATGGSPESSGSGNVSLEAPHASITPKNPRVLMEYGPGASLTGPSNSAPSSNDTSGTVSGSSSYANMIMNAATQSGVNPYVLAAMIIQEQGSAGNGKSVSGTESGYEGFYNFFNIEAYQSGNMSAVQRGLWWASQTGNYGRPWNSSDKSILGGALYYGNNYVKVGQDTFYLKKFNVQGANIYKHQYMTNVQGAASEGAVFSKAYNSDMKKTSLEFKVPIYNNMPETPCSQPTGDGNTNNMLAGLNVEGFVMTPTFNRDTLEYNLIVDPTVTNIKVSASALTSASSVSGTGTIALQNGNNDIKISVTAQNGTVREYILHVVRQNNGPTYSSGTGNNNSGSMPNNPGSTSGSSGSGNSSGSNNSGSSSSGSGKSGPGSSGPGKTTNEEANKGTPGGSNVTVVPVGNTNVSVQTSTGVITQGPGGSKPVTEQVTETQTQAQETTATQTASLASGDIDGDGKISSKDVLKVQRYILGLEKLSEKEKKAADLNGDGKVDSKDLLLLKKKVLGL